MEIGFRDSFWRFFFVKAGCWKSLSDEYLSSILLLEEEEGMIYVYLDRSLCTHPGLCFDIQFSIRHIWFLISDIGAFKLYVYPYSLVLASVSLLVPWSGKLHGFCITFSICIVVPCGRDVADE